ncbi:hypothetical protein QYM36_000646 [Artemia franciscana]|uniref:Endonuclease/exonuclease/phosphatase domain-containing protein n=1 Tax=Artemia franciscana TaxID=6661 RepID=A0AA88IDR1_ARTSF|nr:hypothetical protein QYM36_000646 [Artemia franciscana]
MSWVADDVTTGSARKITGELTTGYAATTISNVTNPSSDAPPLFTPKTTLAIGTLNVSTLVKEGKKDILVRESSRYKWDITGLSETHLSVTGVEKLGDTTAHLSGCNNRIHCQGVRFILSKKAKKSLISTTPASELVIAIRLKGSTANLSIIQVYAPDSSRSDEEFYSQFHSLTDSIPKKKDIILVIGDFNASNRIRERLLSEGGTLTVKATETSQAIKAVGETHAQMKNEPSTVAIKQEVEAICQQKATKANDYSKPTRIPLSLILPVNKFRSLKPRPNLLPSKDILTSYSGCSLKVLRIAQMVIQYKDQEPQLHAFHVVETNKGPLLGRQTSEQMNLIKFELSLSCDRVPYKDSIRPKCNRSLRSMII